MTCISEICPLNILHKQSRTNSKVEDDQIEIYSSVDQLPYDWEKLSQKTSIFLQKDYLKALEQAAPEHYQFFYLLFRSKTKPIGISLAHYFPFSGGKGIHVNSSISKWQQQLKKFFLKALNWNFLILGNSTLTGEYGTYFLPHISKKVQFDLLLRASEDIEKHFPLSVDIIVNKDWYKDKKEVGQSFTQNAFHECVIQPNMLLSMRADWCTFDDYLAAMRSKYRVRAKRAFKKLGKINKHYLDAAQIKAQEKNIHRLYRNIADEADLNVAQLPMHYFYTLKQQLGNRFQLLAYFDGGDLIGFCTTIQDGDALEAHFLGLEEQYNTSHQLYLNMLLDMVRFGIEQQVHEIAFSRTALEIKSSIGAVPYDMFGYIKHRNPLINRCIPFLFRFFDAEMEWVQRHPFKELKVEQLMN